MDTKEMKKCRKNIDILQVAATDKENLTRKIAPKKKLALSNDRIRLGKKEGKVIEPDGKNLVTVKNNINKIKTENSQKKKSGDTIIASDLTNDAPSEKYWEKLAESRRVALESALKENVDLTNKLTEMEYENMRLKEMLSEAQSLVEVLTEMLEGDKQGELDDSIIDESFPGRSDEGLISESENDNESFQSCIL